MESTKVKRLWATVGTGILWLGAATGAIAADVKGSVKSASTAPERTSGQRPTYWKEWNGFLPPRESKMDLPRDVAVVLIGEAGAVESVTVEFKGGDLLPRTVVMPAGASLRLRNTDDTSHELYAEGLKTFEPDETRAGLGRQLTLKRAGNWALKDKVAAHVAGHLHVLENVAAIAQPAADGSFSFPDMPAGMYTLKIFCGPDEIAAKPIEVPAGGKSLTVDPVLVTPRVH